MSDDDDLPMLTHVLRTAGDMPPPLLGPLDIGLHDDFGIHPFDETPLEGRLVIGHEPRAADATDAGASFDDHDTSAPVDIVADPRRPSVDDAFRLVQDVDGAAATPAPTPIDEPDLVTAPSDHQAAPDFETPIVFATRPDNEAFAARVRDAVLADLAGRIDTELDARIAQAMHAEVESALARLQSNLRAHLTDALRDVVARAVDDELAQITRGTAATGPH